MLENLFLLICGILTVALIIRLFWAKFEISWLFNTTKYLVWSLPFELFPRIEIGGSGFRISQFLVIFGFLVILVLTCKKDTQLLQKKLHSQSFFPLVFIFLSIPSWFIVKDWTRFGVHFFGTILVFGALFLIMNFTTNVWKRIIELAHILILCSVFGLYQFFGDIIGLPTFATGLKDHYTKAVFGIPRIQGTAVEPLYFAGMLVIPLLVIFILIINKDNTNSQKNLMEKVYQISQNLFKLLGVKSKKDDDKILEENTSKQVINNINILGKKFYSSQSYNIFCFLLVLIVFILTLSKGTFAVLFLVLPFFLTACYLYFKDFNYFVKEVFFKSFLIIGIFTLLSLSFINPVTLFGSIGQNFVDTIAGTSPSSIERGNFLKEAIYFTPSNIIQGIGMGQYGKYVGDNLGYINADQKAIVNNVYVEILLEEGVFAFIWFIIMLFSPLIKLMSDTKKLYLNKEFFLPHFCLFFILVVYYLSWNFFSPIFIMPIFILLGLSYCLTNIKN